jgi:hypothetical protein
MLLVLTVLGMGSVNAATERLKPFVLASVSTGDMKAKITEVKTALINQGFRLIGEYTPYQDAHIVIVTSDELLKLAAKTKRGGYAAAQRVSVTKVNGQIQVAYVNPIYVQYAYHVNGDMTPVEAKLKNALGAQESFGSKKGLKPKKLKKYHYTFGMEYFDEPYEFKTFNSHAAAVAAVEQGLAAGKGDLGQVFQLDIPGTQMTLFGVSMKAGPDGNKNMDDAYQMGIIDFEDVKKTAYLPYTILVNGRDVEALHMRFRAAVHFPDLSMAGENSFMKVMSSPGAIEKTIWELFGGKPKEEGEF